jgi:CRP/FNR family transcriptional regulator, cyclic AMP receptor protein
MNVDTSSYFIYPTLPGEAAGPEPMLIAPPGAHAGSAAGPVAVGESAPAEVGAGESGVLVGPEAGLLAARTAEDWDVLLDHTETRRLRPGDWLIRAGERDRALYVLSDGRLEAHVPGRPPRAIDAPATVGELAFLDGRPRSAGLRALTHGEAERLSYDAFEALSARHPHLARALLLDLGRIVVARLRAVEAQVD